MLKPNRVDVFGEQNLKQAVEEALSSGYNFVDEEEKNIKLIRKTEGELGSTFPYFDALFNPVEGSIPEAPDELSYEINLSRTHTVVYEEVICSRTVELSGEAIGVIQEESLTSDRESYNEDRFRAFYNMAKRGDLDL